MEQWTADEELKKNEDRALQESWMKDQRDRAVVQKFRVCGRVKWSHPEKDESKMEDMISRMTSMYVLWCYLLMLYRMFSYVLTLCYVHYYHHFVSE